MSEYELQPKVLTPVGMFDIVKWPGRNTSGIRPFGDRVLILTDQASSATMGGVMIPPEMMERVAEAAETGVLVAIGDGAWAWNGDRSRRYEGVKPAVGQRVYFERYAGGKFHGRDGLVYRLMDDKCIGGLAVEPEGEPVDPAGPTPHQVEATKLQAAITGGA